MKKISISTVIIAVLSAVIVGSSGFAAYKYLTTDRSMLGSEGDKLASHYGGDNVNVMLTRSENWRQITEEKFLTRPDFAGIDGSTATIPITAELARQFCGASDDTTYRNNYVGSFVNHNKTDVAYAVIRSDESQDSVYRRLRDYMLSEEGQEIVRLAGYCPVKG